MVTALAYLGQGRCWLGGAGLPRSLPIIDGLLTLLFIGGTRFSLRAAEYLRARRSNGTPGTRALIAASSRISYGRAGDAGEMVAREMRTTHKISLEPVGFVDDNPYKQGVVIHGVRVLGNLAQIPELVEEYQVQEVIILSVSEVEPGHACCKAWNITQLLVVTQDYRVPHACQTCVTKPEVKYLPVISANKFSKLCNKRTKTQRVFANLCGRNLKCASDSLMQACNLTLRRKCT